MKSSIKCILFILCLPVWVQAAIYQKIDSNGTVYFSDTLTPNATLLQLKPINIYTTTPITEKSSLATIKNTESNYKKFSITQPSDQQTFQNQREISAVLQIEPSLRTGDKVVWWLDGKSYQTSTDTQIVLKSLDRGEHQLQAKLRNANNQDLMSTTTIVFYVHYAMAEETH